MYEEAWGLATENDAAADAHNDDTFGADAPIGNHRIFSPYISSAAAAAVASAGGSLFITMFSLLFTVLSVCVVFPALPPSDCLR